MIYIHLNHVSFCSTQIQTKIKNIILCAPPLDVTFKIKDSLVKLLLESGNRHFKSMHIPRTEPFFFYVEMVV